MPAAVELTRHGKVGVIAIDNPPVNAMSALVRGGIAAAYAEGLADPDIAAFVIVGKGRHFSAGADIAEFGRPASPGIPRNGDLAATFEVSPKPVVAAIDGVALGGGLEVALGCRYRMATPGARCGFPEVELGLIPGSGGTQRLPRLIGFEPALEIIAGGQQVAAQRALALGILDQVVEGDLVEAAIKVAAVLAAGKGRQRSPPEPAADAPLFDEFRQRMARKARGRQAPLRCIESVENALRLPFDEGLAREREIFEECMASPESRALRWVFAAARRAADIPGLPRDTPVRDIASVAIVGAGTMGRGIAMAMAAAGIPVRLLEADREALDGGLAAVAAGYASSVARGRLEKAEMERRLALLSGTLDYRELGDADLVIEAVFEDMDLKRRVFRELDQACRPGTILATNTSYLDVNEIAAATGRPESVIGTHFFSPAQVMRLVEVVRAEETAPEVLATVMKLAKDIGKIGVVVGVCHGFAGNRMLAGYLREAHFLIEEGALPHEVDRVLHDFGMPMGPFAMGDLAGLDIGWRMRKSQAAKRPAGERYSPIADRLCEGGRLGQKTGRGWYRYADGERKPIPDPEVEALIVEVSRELGIERRRIGEVEIIERCLYPLINEGARILEEGIAQRPGDLDVIWINGYGFPAHLGGPMHWAGELGLDRVRDAILGYREVHGKFWRPAPLLSRLADEGQDFASLRNGRGRIRGV